MKYSIILIKNYWLEDEKSEFVSVAIEPKENETIEQLIERTLCKETVIDITIPRDPKTGYYTQIANPINRLEIRIMRKD